MNESINTMAVIAAPGDAKVKRVYSKQKRAALFWDLGHYNVATLWITASPSPLEDVVALGNDDEVFNEIYFVSEVLTAEEIAKIYDSGSRGTFTVTPRGITEVVKSL